MDTGLTLHFKPSKQLALFYLLLGFVSLIGVMALPFNVWIKLGISLLVLLAIVYAVKQHALLTLKSSIVSLVYQPQAAQKQRWKVVTKAGVSVEVSMRLQDCFVSPYLTVLTIEQPQKQFLVKRLMCSNAIIILPDRLSKDAYRQLRVLLNWGNHKSEHTRA